MYEKFQTLCSNASRIAIISHTNPDGDAIGSGLALTRFLRDIYPNNKSRFFVPNHFPQFLAWADPEGDVEVFKENAAEAEAFLAAADLIIIVDFNQTSRLEQMSKALDMNLFAPRVLIDHHINPPQYDLMFHSAASSSTAFLVYELIVSIGGEEVINKSIAEALYLGMMSDTGGFSFGNLTPALYRTLAVLVERGLNPVEINRAFYNTQSEDRVRLMGYLVSEKMVVKSAKRAAYITLDDAEKEKYKFQIGDSEGIVNIPLSVNGIDFSAFMMQTKECIKISLRSVGDLDVNVICNEHFNGGGHRNAAGGKFFGTMEQAVVKVEAVIAGL